MIPLPLRPHRFLPSLGITLTLLSLTLPLRAQLFDNLRALSNEIQVGQPRWETVEGEQIFINENPKGLAAGDLDGDGKGDWMVSRLDGRLLVGWGQGDHSFLPPQVIPTPADSFRQIIIADLNNDGRLDAAAAAPLRGKIYCLFNLGARSWSAPVALNTWPGARNLCALDWDGDGLTDLMVGGSDKNVTRDFDRPWERPEIPPDTVQPRHGVVFYKGLGAGAFEERARFIPLATVSQPPQDAPDSFPRPVYVLEKWRPPGQSRDWLVATHALASEVYVLRSAENGSFIQRDIAPIGAEGTRAMVVGALTQPATSPQRDLVLASRDLGTITVFRLRLSESDPILVRHQQLDVQGGPRSLKIADVDGDGWNDLVALSRNRDKAVVFKNTAGTLARSTESSTGASPRELAEADFDGDGRSDFVVLNRNSASLTILNAAAATPGLERAGFSALDQSYPVEGDLAQLGLVDINADGRDDVIQLHRSSAEVSVRLSGPQGVLHDPTSYLMGSRPSAMSLADIDRDGNHDLVTANLGDELGGLMIVRLGDGLGGFGPAQSFRPPTEPAAPPPTGSSNFNDPQLPAGVRNAPEYGNLYAVLPVDLDGDGILDLAAGYYDCRIIFFKGDGNGGFTATPGFSDHELYFMTGYEARYIVAADFDQDGDQDLALAAWPGDVVVLENTGRFFEHPTATQPPYIRHFFPRFDTGMAQARDIQIVELNGDDDPDLVIGTGAGTQVLLGKSGVDFERRLYAIDDTGGPAILPVPPTINFPIAAMVTGDFDGDGDSDDMASICADDGCLHILTAANDRSARYFPALIVDAPRTTFLATGDLDGDGKTDLVGTGSTLWVALSGRRTQATLPSLPPPSNRRADGVVINEILPANTKVKVTNPLEPSHFDQGDPDCIELYNAGTLAQPVGGWILMIETPDGTLSFPLPEATLPPGGRAVALCTRNRVGPWVTKFKLPESGATVSLRDTAGAVIDEATYPDMKLDESYARYSDGHPVFRVNELPDPGRTNLDNGPIEPSAELHGIDLRSFAAGQPIRFQAVAEDDIGIVGMSVQWRLRNSTTAEFTPALLFDDGQNEDGGRLDGVFAGVIESPLPEGAEIEFYLEAEDLSGEKKFIPGRPTATSEEDMADELYTLRIPGPNGPPRSLEISEILASNQRTVPDESGQFEDYFELRNTGQDTLSLFELEISENLFGSGGRLKFSQALSAAYPADDLTMPPGRHRLIFCDGDNGGAPTQFHSSFKLSAENGGRLYLFRRTPAGTQEIVDYAFYPPLAPDVACARIGVRGPFFCLPPTPGGPNVAAGSLIPMIETTDTGPKLQLAVPTRARQLINLFSNETLGTGDWWPVLPGTLGDGFERLVTQPAIERRRFFRLQDP
ncbi:MAG: FG-GAP-like repeat-containing protein [Verrucomicrobiales bacterium]